MYAFPSIIFTCYATSSSGPDIVAFCSQREDIDVITAPYGNSRFPASVIQSAHDAGLKVYNHTVNTFDKYDKATNLGVDGFYTDEIIPDDLN